jgi:hypothetical protein
MAPESRKWTMRGMSTPTVVEVRIELEPVTDDPFVADLALRSLETEARVAAFVERAAAAPHRRIYD